MIEHVLFDFDGTLVDSAPGIINGFKKVFAAEGIAPLEPVDSRVIGPALLATLRRLTGLGAGAELDRLAAAFRATYDADGVLDAHPYPALVETLDALGAERRRSYIVTNKRAAPTRLITDRIGITARMTGIYSLDSRTPPFPRKAAVVAHLLATHGIDARDAVMVGDSAEDAEAAAHNGMRFVAARYGYGDTDAFTGAAPAGRLSALAELPALLASLD